MKSRLFYFIVWICTCAYATEVKIANWNVQTFFDSTRDGTELAEFTKKTVWTDDLYKQRLQYLAKALLIIDADIVVLEEIEKAAILYDISNALSQNTLFTRKRYRWACFGKAEDAAFGIAVLSCYPITASYVHALDIRTESIQQPLLRPLLEAHITVTTRTGEKSLVIYGNHWKSKRDGTTAASVWHQWQGKLLLDKMEQMAVLEPLSLFVVCGDFNTDVCSDSMYGLAGQTLKTANTDMYNPWRDQSCLPGNANHGSYYYNNIWSRLDHILIAPSNHYVPSSFAVERNELWAFSDGRPKAYRISDGSGCSDHLPISCRIRIDD
ncbi:MAG: endonuclease/exonuclease/phosphatase family protein [Treponema sp.]|nr:endonuclease/exonuclease/phosphatase family protein [Treponema sp.]